MPKDTPFGVYIGILSFIFGFCIVWHIWWLVILAFLGIITCVIVRLSDDHTDYFVPAAEVEAIENKACIR